MESDDPRTAKLTGKSQPVVVHQTSTTSLFSGGANLLPLPYPSRAAASDGRAVLRQVWRASSRLLPRKLLRLPLVRSISEEDLRTSFCGNLTYSTLDEIRELLRRFKVSVDQGEEFESGMRRWSIGTCFATLNPRQYAALKTKFPRKEV
jgi:hypothetical protein